jgi:hypothetical protein
VEGAIILRIAFDILPELCLPEFTIRGGSVREAATCMLVPEASMDMNDGAVLRKNQIRLPR